MNRKILLVLCAVASILPTSVFAQNADHRYGISISGGPFEYAGDYGNSFFFGQEPKYWGINYGLGYYINPSFDATLFGNVGDIGWRQGGNIGFQSRISSVLLGVRYKLNNGTIMDEDSKFKAHILLGYGGMQSVSTMNHNDPNYIGWSGHRTWYAAMWTGGICLKYSLTDNIDIQYELGYNYIFDDNLDGNPFSPGTLTRKGLMEQFLAHGIGLTYNFNIGDGPVKIADEDNTVPKEIQAKVDAAAATIEFETNSSNIKEDSYADLDSIAAILIQYPAMNAYVEGHTDNVGESAYNMQLSQERAEAVKTYLVDKGVSKKRLEAEGFGDTQPIEKNDTEEGRAANRRVQVKLYYK